MMRHLKYLCYVIRHRWFVLLECRRRGILWLGITHDLSKFLLDEFGPYAEHFYGNGRNIKPTDTGDPSFDFAWLLHQKRNKHHWQWWCLPEDEGGIKVLEMPDRYRREMLADWRGAGRALGTPDTRAWYAKNGCRMTLGPKTRQWIEDNLKDERANPTPDKSPDKEGEG